MNKLIVQNLQKSYGSRKVIRGIDLELLQGEVIGLLGPNGAGKSTSFYMIVGLIKSDAGSVFLNEEDVTLYPMYERSRLGLGYLPQEISIFRKMTVEENIYSVLEIIEPNKKNRVRKLKDLLEEFSIGHIRKSNAMSLSGGERRRVEIARALAKNPKFVLFDEPFAGVDPIAVNDIMYMIKDLKQRGIGVLITDHNVRETLSIVDRAYIVFDGKILKSGTSEDIYSDENVRKVYLGENFK